MDTLTGKQHILELVERLGPEEIATAARFLESLLVPVDDEEITEEEQLAVARSKEWLKHNKPIPHEEVLAEFGLSMQDFEKMGRTPLPPEQGGPVH